MLNSNPAPPVRRRRSGFTLMELLVVMAILEVLVSGVDDAQSPKAAKIYLMRRLPRDPMAPPELAATADTWAVRSYASPPDDPQPGKDVFDVFSKSTAVGLNGVPYRQW